MAQDFTRYRRTQIAELRPYEPGESLEGISVDETDKANGSPKAGDMIARNPVDHQNRWLVAATYFAANFEPALEPAEEASKDQQIAKLQDELRLCEAARDAARGDRDQSDAQLRELKDHGGL